MEEQAKFEGWAIIEMMGHRREIGFVTTETFGAGCLFRVDTPELPEREYELTRPEWVGQDYAPIGAKVKRPATPARSCLVGPPAIYAINPCTEEAARKAIESTHARPLILLSLPEKVAIPAGQDIDDLIDNDPDPDFEDQETL